MLKGQEIPRYTIEDYQHWKDDWEIINGYPFAMTPSPFFKHQKFASRIVSLLLTALDKCDTCDCDVVYETDWIISIDTIVRPDILVVCDQINENDFVRTTPPLIIEVFSDRTKLKDRNVKFNLYQSCGVRYYLMVDPENKRVEYFELDQNKFQQREQMTVFTLKNESSIEVDLSQVFN